MSWPYSDQAVLRCIAPMLMFNITGVTHAFISWIGRAMCLCFLAAARAICPRTGSVSHFCRSVWVRRLELPSFFHLCYQLWMVSYRRLLRRAGRRPIFLHYGEPDPDCANLRAGPGGCGRDLQPRPGRTATQRRRRVAPSFGHTSPGGRSAIPDEQVNYHHALQQLGLHGSRPDQGLVSAENCDLANEDFLPTRGPPHPT